MDVVTSLSGGRSSAYVAANYPSDHLVFALVTCEDTRLTPKDKNLVRLVSDRIGREFVGTLEDDLILTTMLDLEQFLGQKIHWVVGKSFERVLWEGRGVKTQKKPYLPNISKRICTQEMKLRPIFRWWLENIGTPVEMQIGYRANEKGRVERMREKLNADGLSEFKDFDPNRKADRLKWFTVGWQKPVFPMFEDGVFADGVHAFWKGKPVKFAPMNNCVGCFHRNPILLRKMFDHHPDKMRWFAEQESLPGNPQWKKEVRYDEVQNHRLQHEIDFNDFTDCDSGYCGI